MHSRQCISSWSSSGKGLWRCVGHCQLNSHAPVVNDTVARPTFRSEPAHHTDLARVKIKCKQIGLRESGCCLFDRSFISANKKEASTSLAPISPSSLMPLGSSLLPLSHQEQGTHQHDIFLCAPLWNTEALCTLWLTSLWLEWFAHSLAELSESDLPQLVLLMLEMTTSPADACCQLGNAVDLFVANLLLQVVLDMHRVMIYTNHGAYDAPLNIYHTCLDICLSSTTMSGWNREIKKAGIDQHRCSSQRVAELSRRLGHSLSILLPQDLLYTTYGNIFKSYKVSSGSWEGIPHGIL